MGKNYCIFRCAKLKTHQDVTNVLKEQHRADDYDSKRADKTLSSKNEYSGTYEEAQKIYDDLLPSKVRKNAVVGLNFLVSASQEFDSAEAEDIYYTNALKFINSHFGKVVGAAIHRDETSTHMQVVTIPLVNNKLNARELIGGSKQRMNQIQTEFWEQVGKPLGLERGEENSQAVHKTVEQKHKEKERELADKEQALEARENALKPLSEALEKRQMSLDEKEHQLDEKERNLSDREAEVERKGAVLSDYMQHAKDNSLEVLQECEQTKKNKYHTPWDLPKFMQKVYDSICGAWALVKKLTDKNQKLEKDLEDSKKRLENWRNTDFETLEDLASEMRENGVNTWNELEAKKSRQQKRRNVGLSWSD